MIRIAAKKDGFRRCGVAHAKEATDYPDGRWSTSDLEILRKEPMLVVTVSAEQDKRPNAADTIKLVKEAADIAALDALADGEERKSVLEAIEVKRNELNG